MNPEELLLAIVLLEVDEKVQICSYRTRVLYKCYSKKGLSAIETVVPSRGNPPQESTECKGNTQHVARLCLVRYTCDTSIGYNVAMSITHVLTCVIEIL